MDLLAGTSGYSYKEWKGSFYPEKLPADAMLRYYAERFPTVEINNTFYRMPDEEMLARWAAEVPDELRLHAQGAAADHAREAPQGDGAGRRRVPAARGRRSAPSSGRCSSSCRRT